MPVHSIKVARVCERCGGGFSVSAWQLRARPCRFCSPLCSNAPTRTVEQRFWAKVDKDGPVPPRFPELGPCWLWTGGRTGEGYGTFSKGRTNQLAHRYAYEAAHGCAPVALVVRHRCDTPLCVRPDHLVAGTQAENIQDAKVKGRRADGVRHPMARLTDMRVRSLRDRAAHGEDVSLLAKEFAISKGHAYGIIRRKTWKHVM